jgi:undecaprenyl-diphosphatase
VASGAPLRVPVVLVAAAMLAGLTALVAAGVTDGVDASVLAAVRARRGSGLAHVAQAVTGLGDTGPLLTLLLLLALVAPAVSRAGWQLLVLPPVAAVAGWLLSAGLKRLVARPRPPVAEWAGHASGFAFPSGHASTATAGYVVLAVLAAERVTNRRARWATYAAGFVVAGAVGVSRVVLAVHWPTDVLGGWALGLCIAALVLRLGLPRPGTQEVQ